MSNLSIMYTVLQEQFAELVRDSDALLTENRALRTENRELRDRLAKYKYDTWNLKMLRAGEKQNHAA
jgi:regulator of replication initiation timing